MLGIERTHYDLHFDVGNERWGTLFTVRIEWWEYASDVGSTDEHDVVWHLYCHPFTMRVRGRQVTAELRGFVLDALRRHFEPPEGRWSKLAIEAGEDGEVNEYDITITYCVRMHPTHLGTVRALIEGIAGTLGGILENAGVLRLS